MNQVSVEIGGRVFERWQRYRLDSSVLIPSDGFSVTMYIDQTNAADLDALRYITATGVDVKVYIDDVLQHTGIINQRRTEGDRNGGGSISLSCLDNASHLTHSSVPASASREAGTNFVDLVKELVRPWGFDVQLDATAARHIATGERQFVSSARRVRQQARRMGIPRNQLNESLIERARRTRQPIDQVAGIDGPSARAAERRAARNGANGLTASDVERVRLAEARPQISETRWAFITRHASRFGLMVWFDPTGKLVISSPDYGSEPTHRLVRRFRNDPSDPNNIERGEQLLDSGERYSECTVYGRSYGRDATRSRFKATATDESMPFYRPLEIHDNGARSDEECLRAAKRELAKHAANAESYSYTVTSHGGRHLFAMDTMIEVEDELLGVSGSFYCASRTFTGDRDNGPMTQLDLRPVGSIQL